MKPNVWHLRLFKASASTDPDYNFDVRCRGDIFSALHKVFEMLLLRGYKDDAGTGYCRLELCLASEAEQ